MIDLFTSVRRISKKIGVVLGAGLASLTVAGVAGAIPLGPGMGGVPVGTSLAMDPTLGGPVVASQTIPFACGAMTGTLINRVIMNTLGEMDIYYWVTNDGTSADRVVAVTPSDFTISPVVDADYRTDMGGVIAPTSVGRSGTGDMVRWTFWPSAVSPGQITNALMVRTGALGWNTGGTTIITVGSGSCPLAGTYQPM